jgi:hypothetical protein
MTAVERQNDRNIIDIERRWMPNRPYVDPMVEIVIKLDKSFVDLSTFLLEKLLLLLVVILELHLLVLRAVKEYFFWKLRDVNVRNSFDQVLELIPIILVINSLLGIPSYSVGVRYDLARGKRLFLLQVQCATRVENRLYKLLLVH